MIMKRFFIVFAMIFSIATATKAAANDSEFYENLNCMALNIYHEARNEPVEGQVAVAYVTLNRVLNDNFPDTICDVVFQARHDNKGNPKRNQCQFSWYCDGKSDKAHNEAAWVRSIIIANKVMNSYSQESDPTGGAIMYHAVYVHPRWAKDFKKTARIGLHIFYK